MRKCDVKMKINEKYTTNPIILDENRDYILHPTYLSLSHPKVKVTLIDNKLTLKDHHRPHIEYTLVLEPQDILKLMTWLVGQEKHKEETSSKPSRGPEISSNQNDAKKYIKLLSNKQW